MDWLRSAFKHRSESKSYDETNGLVFNDIPLPEEIIMLILSYVDTKTLLSCKLVCKEWNTLICSTHFWRIKLGHINKTTKKHLPWYVYYSYFASNLFDRNLIQNGNAEKDFKNWKIVANGGDAWKKEPVPAGADLLPENVPDFNGETSCFATSYITCAKYQKINLRKNKLIQRILDEFQPTIYMSEWYAGRFDCGCKYKLRARLYNRGELLYEKEETRHVDQWAGREWSKVEIACDKYGKGVTDIEFYHEGVDTQFWAGHYGSKMAGGVVKILFDSLETRS